MKSDMKQEKKYILHKSVSNFEFFNNISNCRNN